MTTISIEKRRGQTKLILDFFNQDEFQKLPSRDFVFTIYNSAVEDVLRFVKTLSEHNPSSRPTILALVGELENLSLIEEKEADHEA